MAITPNHQKLIIPGKNSVGAHDGYSTDQRAIEMWANEGIIRGLIAGSGVTITNPNGPKPTINASGGGGGSVMGHCTLSSGPDIAQINAQAVFLGPTDQVNTYFSYLDIPDPPASGSFNTMAGSWIVAVLGGQSICVFPSFQAPAFTGGGIQVFFQMQTWAINETNVAIYNAGPITFTSGMSYQTQSTDYTLVINGGGDIVLTPGSGVSGTGLVSTAGGFYIVGVTLTILVNAGTTFT